MTLTYNCVICGKLIEHPQVNQYNCDKKRCKRIYHSYLMAMHRKLFKLRLIKDFKEDELNGIHK